MPQFTVYENQNSDSKQAYPYFVDVQNDLLDNLNSRLVIPLSASKNSSLLAISHLCPTLTIQGEPFTLLTQQMTNVPVSALSMPVVEADQYRNDIIAAIDFLITGF